MLDGYELLANAVVSKAADDYTRALCRRDKATIAECERFFTGPDIMLYTKVDGRLLMEKLKQRVIDNNYKYARIMLDKRRKCSC